MTTSDQKALDKVFTALTNKKRRQMLYLLSLQPTSISELAHKLKVSLPAVQRYTKLLQGAKLVQSKKSGRFNFLALDRRGLLLLQNWSDQYHSYWGSNKESLDNYVAGIKNRSK